MAKAVKDISAVLTQLRQNGARITELRKVLIDLLLSSSRPLSVQEILEALKKQKLSPNKSSIYRELDFLLKQKLLIELDVLEGMKRYEWWPDGDHHHHIVCTSCGIVKCIDLCFNEKEITRRVREKSGFDVTSHLLEFFGICSDCR